MKSITDEDIKRAVRNCRWRQKVSGVRGVSICGGALYICEVLIERGQCDTLQRLFQQAQKEEEKNND